MLPAYMMGLRKKDALEKARLLLSDMRLDDRIGHYPSQLSGGERQRVAAARSMVNDPDLILADEPTGNLDLTTQEEVMDIFSRLAHEENKCVIIVSHSPEVAASVDEVYELASLRTNKRRRGEQIEYDQVTIMQH